MAEYDQKQIEAARERLKRKAARVGGFSAYAKRKLEALLAEAEALISEEIEANKLGEEESE